MHTKEVWEDSCLTICVIAGRDGAKQDGYKMTLSILLPSSLIGLQEISNVNDIRWGGWRMCESVCVHVCVRVWEGGERGRKGEGSFLEVFVQGLEFRIVGKHTACSSG